MTISLAITVNVMGADLTLPGVGALPTLEKSWALSEQGSTGAGSAGASWIILTNSTSGEVLSFGAERRATPFGEAHSAWSDMAADVFSHGGYPIWKKSERSPYRVHWIRNNVVDLSSRAGDKITSRKALQYTVIFEPEKPDGPKLIAHGYVFPCGSTRIFVQHTSTTPITDERSQSLALHFLANCRDPLPIK